jgi:hypothetical protein
MSAFSYAPATPAQFRGQTLPLRSKATWPPLTISEGISPCRGEDWRAVSERPCYAVSNLGRVRGPTGRILRLKRHRDGYATVNMTGGPRICRMVHRLVAIAFLGVMEGRPEVNHKNFVRADNRIENLEWVSRKQNAAHKSANGRDIKGENHAAAKLTAAKVKDIRSRRAAGASGISLAREYGVSGGLIGHIVHRRAWRHI